MVTNTPNTKLDLNVVKDLVFQDIDKLLDSFGLEYSQLADNIFMRCPVHEGSDNPQGCSISTDFRVWKCWTHGCHENYGTDIFGFVKGMLETDSFSDALRYISKIYNLDDAKGFTPKVKPVESDLSSILKHFVRSRNSFEQPSFLPAKTISSSPYFESRGFSASTLKVFGVEDCEDKGSPMRYRSIIPIHFMGKQVGYIARSTKPWLEPKYLCSDGLRKTEYFYNYDRAIEHALIKRTLFIVEGQGDVWKMYEAGVTNCVGLFGKTVSETQRRTLLTSGITNLVVLTDNDSAGREAKIKIKRELGRMFTLIFPKMHSKDLGNMMTEKLQQDILLPLKGLY